MDQFGARTLNPLNYSDGEKYSISGRIPSGPDAGRRKPTLVASTYNKRTEFINWASDQRLPRGRAAGRHPLVGRRPAHPLRAVRRRPQADTRETPHSELYYNDIDGDSYLSDNERDEDADGLTNYDESHGRMFRAYWKACYAMEKPYYIDYQGTDLAEHGHRRRRRPRRCGRPGPR